MLEPHLFYHRIPFIISPFTIACIARHLFQRFASIIKIITKIYLLGSGFSQMTTSNLSNATPVGPGIPVGPPVSAPPGTNFIANGTPSNGPHPPQMVMTQQVMRQQVQTQSPMKGPPMRSNDIQSRVTGPFVTHPPKPTRVIFINIIY